MKYIPRGSHIFLTHTDDASKYDIGQKILFRDEEGNEKHGTINSRGYGMLGLEAEPTYDIISDEPLLYKYFPEKNIIQAE